VTEDAADGAKKILKKATGYFVRRRKLYQDRRRDGHARGASPTGGSTQKKRWHGPSGSCG